MNLLKKVLKIIFIVSLLTTPILSQNIRFNNNMFLEAFGNGGAYSLNYDRVIYEDFSFRVGASFIKSEDELVKAFPVIVNYRLYLNNNYFELGVGTTVFTLPLNFGDFGSHNAEGALFTSVISYCFQSAIGINGRIALTPFYYDNKIIPFGGFSIGYSF